MTAQPASVRFNVRTSLAPRLKLFRNIWDQSLCGRLSPHNDGYESGRDCGIRTRVYCIRLSLEGGGGWWWGRSLRSEAALDPRSLPDLYPAYEAVFTHLRESSVSGGERVCCGCPFLPSASTVRHLLARWRVVRRWLPSAQRHVGGVHVSGVCVSGMRVSCVPAAILGGL